MTVLPSSGVPSLTDVPVLVLGFEGEILDELKRKLNVRFVISADQTADIQWNALQYLTMDVPDPDLSREELECFVYVTSFFATFSDIYSRRYRYVSDSVSEIWNAFKLMFYVSFAVIKKYDIDVLIFSNIPHEGFDYVFYLVGRHLNLRTVMCYQSLIPNRFFICSCIEDFGTFERGPQITELEKLEYSLPATWPYMKKAIKDESYSIRSLSRELVRNPRGIRVDLMRYFYASRYRKNVRDSTSKPRAGEKYIYFPLHLQPELTTSALGGMYADQLSALEILSQIIPDGYWIYVKENPKQTEMQRGPLFFKRLNALKNVRLLDLQLDSVDLIKGSDGVALIAGTAGWEALFYGKPVLTFGFAWYCGFKGVTRYSTDVSFLDFVRNVPSSKDAIVKSLNDLLTRAGMGVVDPCYVSQVKSFDRRVNAKSVALSLQSFILSYVRF